MHPIAQQLNAFFGRYDISGSPLVVAYSGGVDSHVLLNLLVSLKEKGFIDNELYAFHINHGLSENAANWHSFTKAQAKAFNVHYLSKALSLTKQKRQSLEAVAREARYQAFKEGCPKGSIILTGHHLNDQVETFFLALKRGSGLAGLGAMSEYQQFSADKMLARPLLDISREAIESYAQELDLKWIEDESNEDCQFDRNFLRHQILPSLNERWQGIEQTIARSINHCQESQQLLDELAQEDLTSLVTEAGTLNVEALTAFYRQHRRPRCHNAIRLYLRQIDTLMPSLVQLSQFEQLLTANEDKNPEVKLGDKIARRFKGEIYLTDDLADISDWQQEIIITNEGKRLTLPDSLGSLFIYTSKFNGEQQDEKHAKNVETELALPEGESKLTVRFSHNNPTIKVSHRSKSRSVKKLLQESGLAPWQRRRVPFIYLDETLIAAIGVFVVEDYAETTQSIKTNNLKLTDSPPNKSKTKIITINWNHP